MDLGGWQIFRLSGTGSVGATIRLYIEQYVKDASKTGLQAKEVMAPLVSNSTIASILHSTVTIVIAFRRQNWDVRMGFVHTCVSFNGQVCLHLLVGCRLRWH